MDLINYLTEGDIEDLSWATTYTGRIVCADEEHIATLEQKLHSEGDDDDGMEHEFEFWVYNHDSVEPIMKIECSEDNAKWIVQEIKFLIDSHYNV